jgi:hypothetical protein
MPYSMPFETVTTHLNNGNETITNLLNVNENSLNNFSHAFSAYYCTKDEDDFATFIFTCFVVVQNPDGSHKCFVFQDINPDERPELKQQYEDDVVYPNASKNDQHDIWLASEHQWQALDENPSPPHVPVLRFITTFELV